MVPHGPLLGEEGGELAEGRRVERIQPAHLGLVVAHIIGVVGVCCTHAIEQPQDN